MINFSDITVVEGQGNFRLVRDIMESEGPSEWMLRSNVTITTLAISSENIVHLWHDGRVDIMETSHPLTNDVPDDDFRELNTWCRRNGWRLSVNNRLMQDRNEFQFWLRLYYSGIIDSPELKKHDEEEMRRMSEVVEEEDE